MPNSHMERIRVCALEALSEGSYLRVDARSQSRPVSVIVVRHQGRLVAWRNLCVHMPCELDCEHDMIFDPEADRLICSRHGIHYDPDTGEALSPICAGRHLQAVSLTLEAGTLWISDPQLQPLDPA